MLWWLQGRSGSKMEKKGKQSGEGKEHRNLHPVLKPKTHLQIQEHIWDHFNCQKGLLHISRFWARGVEREYLGRVIVFLQDFGQMLSVRNGQSFWFCRLLQDHAAWMDGASGGATSPSFVHAFHQVSRNFIDVCNHTCLYKSKSQSTIGHFLRSHQMLGMLGVRLNGSTWDGVGFERQNKVGLPTNSFHVFWLIPWSFWFVLIWMRWVLLWDHDGF